MKALAQTNSPWRSLVPTLILQIIVPVVAYQLLHHNGFSAVDSLAIIAGGSAVLQVATFIYRRSIDPLGAFIFGAILLSVAAALITGSARVTLLRDSVFTGGFGLVYLGSLLYAKPITFYFGRRFAGADQERWDDLWEKPDFRHAHRVMTAVWGVALVIEASVRVVLVYSLPVSTMQAISSPIAGVVIAALAYWSVWYGKRMRKRGLESRGLVENAAGEVVPKSVAAPRVPPATPRVGVRAGAAAPNKL